MNDKTNPRKHDIYRLKRHDIVMHDPMNSMQNHLYLLIDELYILYGYVNELIQIVCLLTKISLIEK
jgi:hypothetical protein